MQCLLVLVYSVDLMIFCLANFRNGRKEKYETSWTIKFYSIKLLMINYWKKFRPISWSLLPLSVKGWRSKGRSPEEL
jgi:hypothetical protein